MKEVIKYKGRKWIEYREPILKLKSIDFAFFLGLIIGSIKFYGWAYLITMFLIIATYVFVSWMYDKETKEQSK